MSIQLMNIPVGADDEVSLVRITGVLDQVTAGPLYDTLYDIIGKGRGKLVVDMSGVDLLTRAAARSLVVAAKLLQAPHGVMRICGARAGVAAMLDGLGYANLIKRDRDVRASLEAMHPAETSPDTGLDDGFEPPLPANTNVAAAADGTHGMFK